MLDEPSPSAPEGFRPGDLLPGAKRVIVVGGNPHHGPATGRARWHEHQETMGTSDRIQLTGL